jgi:hypothetical protein
MAPGVLTPAESESHDPDDEQNDRGDPQEMDCESGTEENQDEKQRKNEQHERTSLSDWRTNPRQSEECESQ